MAGRLFPPGYQAIDGNGAPMSGAKLYLYESGTSTPQDSYSDSDLATANTNPVVADSAGRFGPIFGGASDYKAILKTSAGVTVFTADPVTPSGAATGATQSEVDARLSTTKFVTPATLAEGLGLQGSSVASAATLNIPDVGDYFNVTGTTTITALESRAAGREVTLLFAAALQITHNETSLILPGGRNITTAAGETARFRSEGSGNWRCVFYSSASSVVGGNVLAPHENLIVKQVSNTTVDINADALLVRGANRAPAVLTSVDLTVDITASGANGLDTSTEGNSTWYHLWVIAKADGTVAGLLSTSSSAPTLPTGYIYKGYVGAVYNNSSGNFVAFHQIGNLVAGTQTSLLSAANGITSMTSQSLSAAVPTTAKEVALTAAINAESSSGSPNLEVSSTTAGLGRRTIAGGYSNGTSGNPKGSCGLPIVESQTMYWIADFTTAWNIDLKVTGWRY